MTYTVGQMAKMLGLAGSTLRYYDKEGLLPFVERSSGGIRMFREKDYEWLQIIECLKKAGMSIKDIKKYIVLLQQGDSTIQERLELFQQQRTVLLEQMASLQQTLNTLDYKCWYYETAFQHVIHHRARAGRKRLSRSRSLREHLSILRDHQ